MGLEENITPDDYPIIRIVPSRLQALELDMDGQPVFRKVDTLNKRCRAQWMKPSLKTC